MTEPDHQQLSESTVEPGKQTGGALPPVDVGDLPAPPVMNWKQWPAVAGPALRARSGLAFQTSGLWILSRIFGERSYFQISDGPAESLRNVERLFLGCIDADLCK